VDSAAAQFLGYMLFGAACLFGGMAARHTGLVRETVSRRLHHLTVSYVWSTISFFSIWNLPLDADDLWLALIIPVLSVLPALAALPLGRLCFPKDRPRVGLLAVFAGVANTGSTLGAFLCYQWLEPAAVARGYGMTLVTLMAIAGILVLYPIASACAPEDRTRKPSALRLIRNSFFCLPALSLYAAILGGALSLLDAPYPDEIERFHVITVLFYVASFGGYFGIGLRLRFDPPWKDLKFHGLVFGIRFIAVPLLAWVCLSFIDRLGAGLPEVKREVIMLEAFMPCAIFSVMTANLFNLDSRLASSAWFWNTVAFAVLIVPTLYLAFGA